MADARRSVGTTADGLDLELRLRPPSLPIGYDIDLALFASQIPMGSVAVVEAERASDLGIVGPVESAAAAAVEKESDLTIVVYNSSVRGDDVPPAVTESVADKARDLAIVVGEGQAGGDDTPPAVGELVILASNLDSLAFLKLDPNAEIVKGKKLVNLSFPMMHTTCDNNTITSNPWLPPCQGRVKLNKDGTIPCGKAELAWSSGTIWEA